MRDKFSTVVQVKRRARDGWHVYTCDQLPGLFVVSQNDSIAYHDVPKSIIAIMKLDYKIDCTVTHTITYTEFVRKIALSEMARSAVEERTEDLMAGDPDQTYQFTVQPVSGRIVLQ